MYHVSYIIVSITGGSVHNLIKQKLRERNKTQGWLALRTGLTYAHQNRIINNKIEPYLSTAMKIASALDTTTNDLWVIE